MFDDLQDDTVEQTKEDTVHRFFAWFDYIESYERDAVAVSSIDGELGYNNVRLVTGSDTMSITALKIRESVRRRLQNKYKEYPNKSPTTKVGPPSDSVIMNRIVKFLEIKEEKRINTLNLMVSSLVVLERVKNCNSSKELIEARKTMREEQKERWRIERELIKVHRRDADRLRAKREPDTFVKTPIPSKNKSFKHTTIIRTKKRPWLK